MYVGEAESGKWKYPSYLCWLERERERELEAMDVDVEEKVEEKVKGKAGADAGEEKMKEGKYPSHVIYGRIH